MLKEITVEQLRQRDDERMHEIVEQLRLNDPPDPGDPPPGFAGPRNFFHKLKIKWACQWRKDWHLLESGIDLAEFERRAEHETRLMPPPAYLPGTVFRTPPKASQTPKRRILSRAKPRSLSFPGLFKSARHGFNSGCGTPGLTADDFKKIVEARDPLNPSESAFHGQALVDLYSPPEVIEAHGDLPPIFDKKLLTREEFGGFMASIVDAAEAEKMFPATENILCYHASAHMVTGETLDAYRKKGILYRVHYFAQYFRARPFANFVEKLVEQRIQASLENNSCDALLFKLILNSMIGRFALAVQRFLACSIVPSSQMERVLRSPLKRSTKPLRCEDIALDPIHEVVMSKKNVTEDLAIQIQISVYQVTRGIMMMMM